MWVWTWLYQWPPAWPWESYFISLNLCASKTGISSLYYYLVVVRVKWDYMRVKCNNVRKILSTEQILCCWGRSWWWSCIENRREGCVPKYQTCSSPGDESFYFPRAFRFSSSFTQWTYIAFVIRRQWRQLTHDMCHSSTAYLWRWWGARWARPEKGQRGWNGLHDQSPLPRPGPGMESE